MFYIGLICFVLLTSEVEYLHVFTNSLGFLTFELPISSRLSLGCLFLIYLERLVLYSGY